MKLPDFAYEIRFTDPFTPTTGISEGVCPFDVANDPLSVISAL